MKRALYLTVIYLASMFIGTLVFATLFLLSCNLSMFVTDLSSTFFSLHFFTIGLLISFPIVCILVQVLLVLYFIRHPGKQILSLVLYAVFGLLSWIAFIPTDMKLLTKYYDGHDILSARVSAVSSGVFREEEVVDQTAVTNGGVKDLDVWSVGHQITLAFHNKFLLLCFHLICEDAEQMDLYLYGEMFE